MWPDHYSSQATAYARYRPRYPEALFDALAAAAPSTRTAWDCAAGNGQAAERLSSRFRLVLATDASLPQLAAAGVRPGFRRAVARADRAPLRAGCADLITVAQAVHWFAGRPFWQQVCHAARDGALLALWCYGLLRIEAPIDAALDRFYADTVGTFWPPERRHIDDGLRRLEVPLREIEAPRPDMRDLWSLGRLIGYIGTWSAVKRYREALGEDPMPPLIAELEALWGEPAASRQLRWPLFVRLFRV